MLLLAPLVWLVIGQVPTVPLSGVVVDSSGKPMPGAEVWLVDPPWWYGPKVVGQTKADTEGRFSIPRPLGVVGNGPFMPMALWVYAPGHRLGLLAFEAQLADPDEVVRVEVGPLARATIRLEPPEASASASGPVKGKVEVFAVHRRPARMPRSLVERLAAPIGPDGVATIDGVTPEDIQGLDVRTDSFGTQTREYYQPVAGDRTIRVRPSGRISGKVVVPDPAKAKGWTVTAWTRPDDEPNYSGTVGNHWTETDDHGRFDLPTNPTGALTIRARPPAGVNLLADDLKDLKVVTGANLEVNILAQPAVLVEGYVREAGTGAPMADVSISLFPKDHQGSGAAVDTDEKGRYFEILWPGEVTMHVSGGPRTHRLPPKLTGRTFQVPAGVERFELPLIEMTRGESIRGVVVNAQGTPVAGAAVDVHYPGDNASDLTRARSKTRTDRSGAFLIPGLMPRAEVRLSARKRGEATAELVPTRAGLDAPVTLKLVTSDAIALRGKVLGPDGQPLTNVLVRLRSKQRGTGPPSWNETPVDLEGVESIRTGLDGTFETPRELAPSLLYRAEVVASGMARAETEWLDPPTNRFVDLTLRRIRTLRAIGGRVVDRSGGPVAGALVFQSGDGPRPTRSVTDATGKFRVEGVLEGRAFLFATRDQFRFQALPVSPTSAGDVEIVLVRELEQPLALKATAHPMTRAEEKTLARNLFAIAEPRMQTLNDGRGDPLRRTELSARLDPDRVIALIQNQVVGADSALANVALGLIEETPDEALGLIESDQSDDIAAGVYLTVFAALDPSEAVLRRQILDRAERRARAIKEPKGPANWVDQRFTPLARIADGWLDLGDRARATLALRDARAMFEAVADPSRSSFLCGDLAKALVRVDVPAALAVLDRDPLLKSNNRGHYNNILAEVAERAAEADPAESERLLKEIPQEYARKAATRRACFRMASRDLSRARRLGSGLGEPGLGPLLDILAARSQVATDPLAARKLLEAAYAEFGQLADLPAGRTSRSEIPALMAMGLPVVSRLDPSLVPEYLARCLAARSNRLDQPDRDGVPSASMLAMFVARYDRQAAETVFERVPEGLFAPMPNMPSIQPNTIQSILQQATVFDPGAAVAILDRLPEDPRGTVDLRWGEERRKLDARLAMISALARPLARRRFDAAQANTRGWPISQLD